ncbi:MAG: DUF4058 family protein [Candidatus Eremiobacterota bacterium]
MATPFPGMDAYLERPGLWEEVHAGLIVALQQHLGPLVRPRYRAAVELLSGPGELVSGPDVTVVSTAVSASPLEGERPRSRATLADLPKPEDVVERYLEVRDVVSGEVVTVIEVLSPTNKGDYRQPPPPPALSPQEQRWIEERSW